MSESVLDFAGLETTAAATTEAVVDAPVVDTPAVDTDTPAVTEGDAPAAEGKKEAKQQFNSDGTPKEAAKTEDAPGTEKTPKEIRASLKALRDLDPSHATAVKQLHGAFERWEAAKAIFPGGVKDMQAAKEFNDLVGGVSGYEALNSVKAAAEASDAKLYDPAQSASLIEDVVADLKAQNKLTNLGPLSGALLEAAKTNDAKGFEAVITPYLFNELEAANLPGVIAGLEKALSDPDPAKAIADIKNMILGKSGMKQWYDGMAAENKKTKEAVVSPERKALDEERAAFLKEQNDFKTNQTTEFKNSVAKVCEKSNNTLLGKELAPFLKMPFFQGYGKENLTPLGTTIKNNLYEALKSDSAYQAQMKAMWGAKTPDRAKIEEYHRARVESISKDIVRDTVQKMYPGYTKGGAAAGRVAAATAKKDATAKVEEKAVASGKPVYVAQKPGRDALDMDHKDKNGTPDAIIEMIAGRGFLKGSGKWVTWRK
jgi:hypothetical protein